MKCTFYRPQEVNLSEFRTIVEKLRADLHELETQSVDMQEVCHYVSDLFKYAKPLEQDPGMIFWGLGNPNLMPHDARVEFFYQPTYLATAFLMRAVMLYPELMDETQTCRFEFELSPLKLELCLRSAMNACTGRDFDGAGVLSLAECIKIFKDAGAVEFLQKYSKRNCQFFL